MVRPMASENSPLPSPSILIVSPTFWSLPQAPITNASLTEMQTISSTPFAFSAAASARKPGTCLALQVGVKAPGSANATTFLPGANNSSVVTALGPSGPIVRNVALGTLSPTFTIFSLPHRRPKGDFGQGGNLGEGPVFVHGGPIRA